MHDCNESARSFLAVQMCLTVTDSLSVQQQPLLEAVIFYFSYSFNILPLSETCNSKVRMVIIRLGLFPCLELQETERGNLFLYVLLTNLYKH